MIDITTAKQLLDFGARIGDGPRAQEQLEGSVAIYNILEKHRVAYLADEVGMGKTYVALGALALFRHFRPDFRLLVVTPRKNIQHKWMKEFGNFAAYNVRFPDLRVKTIDGYPARPLVACENLTEFAREIVVDSRRDFFLRLSSFSLALGNDIERDSWKKLRDELREEVPWLPATTLDLQVNREVFKENFARALCCALPVFDLVIVDEAHNLKQGFRAGVAARNRVLGLALGRGSEPPSEQMFPGYGRRATRVLFLSATPLEESYRQLWNQLDIFGVGGDFRELTFDNIDDDAKKRVAAQFLIRRVTTMCVAGENLSKNQYRREWRRGGVHKHDEPILISDDRQRLVVALVQKKVAELLESEKFNGCFQIGMLASFESFLETARLKQADENAESNFDDEEQAEDIQEREGIDVRDVNRLARDYRRTFGTEMPHPKMDALVESLADAWIAGKKAMIFVRRVASVKELKRKLDERYDQWLMQSLRARLPESALPRYEAILKRYREEKNEADGAKNANSIKGTAIQPADSDEDLDDRGGTDTFFAWFFRGKGPRGVISGANVQRRFIQRGTAYATFFEDNYVMDVLNARPGEVAKALGQTTGLPELELRNELQRRATKYLSRAKKHPRADRMEAAQAAALELLKDRQDTIGDRARIIWHERFEMLIRKPSATEAPDVIDGLEQVTFFTELRRSDQVQLRSALWPESRPGSAREQFREQQLRAQVLATTARLGHSLIDLYALTIQRLGSIELRTLEADREEGVEQDQRRIDEYLNLLQRQRNTPLSERSWGALDELAQIAQNFDLILDVNAPDAQKKSLAETARYFGSILRQQQPVGGMSGQINRTLVQQFRMPGYPFVLISTDLLQEGEDLHTFCSSVHHYGIAWTPSAMEQRIGRIDRVRSQTDRRLSEVETNPAGVDLLQVYYPHLEDTVEVLQVQRVLERMNVFLRLMHEGLSLPKGDHSRIDVGREIIAGRKVVEVLQGHLVSAFPIPKWAKHGPLRSLDLDAEMVDSIRHRFEGLTRAEFTPLNIKWEQSSSNGTLLGTVTLPTGRIQPFALLLKSERERIVVRCVSPVGRVGPDETMIAVEESARTHHVRLGVILDRQEALYDLTVEEDILLGNLTFDIPRVSILLKRVSEQADLLEQIHLPALDQPLSAFEEDLKREGRGGRA